MKLAPIEGIPSSLNPVAGESSESPQLIQEAFQECLTRLHLTLNNFLDGLDREEIYSWRVTPINPVEYNVQGETWSIPVILQLNSFLFSCILRGRSVEGVRCSEVEAEERLYRIWRVWKQLYYGIS